MWVRGNTLPCAAAQKTHFSEFYSIAAGADRIDFSAAWSRWPAAKSVHRAKPVRTKTEG
jgi:hypothetical protein